MTAIPALAVPSVTVNHAVVFVCLFFKQGTWAWLWTLTSFTERVTGLCQEDKELYDVSNTLGWSSTKKEDKMRMDQQRRCLHKEGQAKCQSAVHHASMMSQITYFIWSLDSFDYLIFFGQQHKHTCDQRCTSFLLEVGLFITVNSPHIDTHTHTQITTQQRKYLCDCGKRFKACWEVVQQDIVYPWK